MTRALAALALAALVVSVRGADLAFPAGDKVVRVRIEVTDGDKSPEAAWATFLDALLAHFDRDGSGSLSEAEAKRVFPLPLFEGKTVGPDFAAMDADRDGKVTAAEFRAFYRAKGFTPAAVVVQPAAADALALGDVLFRHLDRDRDDKLSAAELRQAAALLKRLDDDEDEVLTAKELLGTEPPAGDAKPAGAALSSAKADATLRLDLGGKVTLASDNLGVRLDAARLRLSNGACTVTVSKDDPAAGLRTAKRFYLAQFKAVAGDKPATKAQFEEDATAQVLVGLFDAADRDADGKLTLTELEALFALAELGVGCRVVATVTDRGRNLFDLFDADGDGRLTLGELLHAGRTWPDELAPDRPLARAAVPAAYRLTVGRGPVGDAFGPVRYGTATKPKPPVPKAAGGPAWFRALDKNGDGFVSASEFVGPPELFAKLDADRDGRISAAEAEVAKP